jgi:hypothetical protein
MNTLKIESEGGIALIHALFVSLLLAGASTSLLMMSMGNHETVQREEAIVRARLAAEEGVYRCIAELKEGVDADTDGLGNLSFTGSDGREVFVEVLQLAPPLYRIRSQGRVLRATQTLEVVAELVSLSDGSFGALAAITAKGNVVTSGNINIDGNDHDATGTVVVGPGVPGIAAGGNISNNGSSDVGGVGVAPAHPAPAGTISPNIPYGDGLDTDGDGVSDEEILNGLDDDGDGLIDEDLQAFPSSPDALFGLEEGTFAQAAMARGTYFSTESAFDNFRSENGGFLPGGQIYYLDFPTLLPAYLNSDPGGDPSILIHHQEGSEAKMKNIHGFFKGLLILDDIEHFNANFLAVGAGISLGTGAQIGNSGNDLILGNGNADILYSSSVLSNLPGLSDGYDIVRVRSWQKVANHLD